MIQRSKLASVFLGIGMISLLTACATSATAPEPKSVAQTEKKNSADDQTTLIGSRLPNKSSDHLIRQMDAKELERDRSPNSGPKF